MKTELVGYKGINPYFDPFVEDLGANIREDYYDC